MNIKDFKVGQTAYVLDPDSRNNDSKVREATVTKIGRKYVSVAIGAWDVKFGPEEWAKGYLVENTDIGSKKYLFQSQEDVSDYLEIRDLRIRLRQAAEWPKRGNYSLAQLRAAVRILEDPDYKEAIK